MANFGFEVSEYESVEDYSVMPEGDYKLKATEAESKETSTGGEMIAATFVVIEPAEYKGRIVWTNFNVINKSEKAQNFGRRMLAGWARAAGKPNANDTDQLLDRPFWAILGIEKGSGKYKDKNVVTSFRQPDEEFEQVAKKPVASAKATEEETSAPASTKTATPPPSKPAAGKKPAPWDNL